MDRDKILKNFQNIPIAEILDYFEHYRDFETLKELIRMSSDLEDDALFKALKRKREQLNKEEENEWNKIQNSTNINEITDYINKFQNGGKYVGKAEEKRRNIREQRDSEDYNAWVKIQNSADENDFFDYIDRFQNDGKYIEEANRKILELRERGKKERNKILEMISKDFNAYSPGEINEFLCNNTITYEDLTALLSEKIDPDSVNEIIHKLYEIICEADDTDYTDNTINEENIENSRYKFISPDFDKIPEGFTEVYFWGMPGSGKTCALAAVLSAANTGGILHIEGGLSGSHYTRELANQYINDIEKLPAKTSVQTTKYLPFVLNVGKDDPRSVSLFELSGEVFEGFLHYEDPVVNSIWKTPQKEESFNKLLRYLKGKNRKIHFFFVDYGRGNKKNKNGITQKTYLDAAANYFNKHNIIDENTDAIYLVLTKSDLLEPDRHKRKSKMNEEMKSSTYPSLVSSLRSICKKHRINGGILTGFPFSLGNVYFQTICHFEKESGAETIIEILTKRIQPDKGKSIFDNLLNN